MTPTIKMIITDDEGQTLSYEVDDKQGLKLMKELSKAMKNHDTDWNGLCFHEFGNIQIKHLKGGE